MASGPARIAINWREVFGATSSSPVREVEVCSASPSSLSDRDLAGRPASAMPITIDWRKVFGSIPDSPSSPVAGRPPPAAAAVGGGGGGTDRDRLDGDILQLLLLRPRPRDTRTPSTAPHAAAAMSAAKRPRAAGDPERASSDDEQRPDRFEAVRSKLHPGAQADDEARLPVTCAAAKAAAGGRGGRADAGAAAAKNVFSLGQEDEGDGENLACKYCSKSSPVLVTKKNHGQADDLQDAHPAPSAKNNKEASPPEEIFEALRAIPSLARDDLLRAYSTLIRDERQFRSLLALPMDMRKDWLLMEIGNQ